MATGHGGGPVARASAGAAAARSAGTVVAEVRERFAPSGGTDRDEEAYPLTGDELDLEPLARDAVLLELPLAPAVPRGLPGPVPDVRGQPEHRAVRLRPADRPPLGGARRPARRRTPDSDLGCPPYGRSEEEDLQGEEPQPPGIQLGAEGAGTLGVPPVHHRQAAPRRLPQLRLVQRPTGHRSRLVARRRSRGRRVTRSTPSRWRSTPWAATRHPVRSSPVRATVAEPAAIGVLLVGLPGADGRHRRPAAAPLHRGHRHGRRPRPGRAPQEGLVAGAGGRGGARRPGHGHGLGRQHRRHHGLGPAADGPAPRGRSGRPSPRRSPT